MGTDGNKSSNIFFYFWRWYFHDCEILLHRQSEKGLTLEYGFHLWPDVDEANGVCKDRGRRRSVISALGVSLCTYKCIILFALSFHRRPHLSLNIGPQDRGQKRAHSKLKKERKMLSSFTRAKRWIKSTEYKPVPSVSKKIFNFHKVLFSRDLKKIALWHTKWNRMQRGLLEIHFKISWQNRKMSYGLKTTQQAIIQSIIS